MAKSTKQSVCANRSTKSTTTDVPPVEYDHPTGAQAERAEQLLQVVSRLLASNRQLEEEVREHSATEQDLREKLESLQQLLGPDAGTFRARFGGDAGHELRTPLSTILSSASLARQYANAGNTAKRDQHLDKIRAAVSRLTEVLQYLT